jgi:small subunit ribosomal protein S8
MALSDTIADMLTRVRNAARNKVERVDCRHSNICRGIAKVLKEEGYITDFTVIEDGRQGILRVSLRYGPHGEPLFHLLKRESKPGRRVYVHAASMPRPLAGLGIAIVSTPRGVLSDRQARAQNVGGEWLCTVE